MKLLILNCSSYSFADIIKWVCDVNRTWYMDNNHCLGSYQVGMVVFKIKMLHLG
jgi:hypothetical protein